MPPAARRLCDYPGCQFGPIPDDPEVPRGPYMTQVKCQTRAEVMDDYKTHIEAAHNLPLKNRELTVKQTEADTNKLLAENAVRQSADTVSIPSNSEPSKFNEKRDPIPRPKIGLGASEADWGFFRTQWSRYTAGSNMTDQQQFHQVWARQTHVTEPPFRQAMSVPPHTWRFSSDAWNGYHSILLDKRDRHAITFLPPWGRLRYRVAPQGSISSGDGYTLV